nr:hypothetical protein [uncultured Rhodopila sp.]
MNLLTLPLTAAISPAAATTPAKLNGTPRNLTVQANFTWGSGGTTADAYLQTSLDGGLTWTDIANFHFTTSSARFVFNLNAQTPVTTEYTPTNGAIAANTCKDGVLGPQFRVLYQSSGTYAGTTLAVDVQGDQIPSFP